MDRPEPFLEITDSGKIELKEKAIRRLEKIQVPITVISLIGKYRTGKSFLLNRFFGENHGFPVDGSVQSMTKGIWLWARPHPLDPSRFLVLLDTEGLHDAEQNNTAQDMQIFSLVMLLSSCCIYNAMGTIDEILIKQLNLVAELTEHIHIKPGEFEDGNHFNKYFPAFVVMLRDFFLDLKIDDKPCTPDEYLENALKLQNGPDQRNKRLKEYNMPRECIRAFFPKRRCFTLCRPVDDEKKLVRADKLTSTELNPEFRKSCDTAINQILEMTHSYEVDGYVITGESYIQLVKSYVDSMNGRSVPCISNAVSQLQQSQCQLALDEAVGIFDDHMTMLLKDRLPVFLDELATASNASHAAAIEHFKKKALFDREGQFFTKLSKALNENLRSHLNKNATQSQYVCRQALHKSFGPVESNMKTDRYHVKGGYKVYLKDKDDAIQEYEATPRKGPLANEELQNYLESKHSTDDAILHADKAMKAKERNIELEAQERRRQDAQIQRQRENNQRMAKEILCQQEANQEIFTRLKDVYEQQQRKHIEDHARDIEDKNLELEYFREQGLHKQMEEYEGMIGQMEIDKETMQTDYKQEKEQIDALSKQHTEMINDLREKRELDLAQLQSFQKSMNDNGQANEGGGITGWIGSVITDTVNWLYGEGN